MFSENIPQAYLNMVKLSLLLRTTSSIPCLRNASGPRTNTEKQLLDIASSSSGAVCSKSALEKLFLFLLTKSL